MNLSKCGNFRAPTKKDDAVAANEGEMLPEHPRQKVRKKASPPGPVITLGDGILTLQSVTVHELIDHDQRVVIQTIKVPRPGVHDAVLA